MFSILISSHTCDDGRFSGEKVKCLVWPVASSSILQKLVPDCRSVEVFLWPGGRNSSGQTTDGLCVLLTSVNTIRFCDVSKSMVSYVVDPWVSSLLRVVAWL